MASYHYLIASLPELQADQDMPLTYEEFLGLCKNTVERAVYEELENLTLASQEGPLVSKWAQFYRQLTQELNLQRSQRLGKACKPPEDKDPLVTNVATAALHARNPLEAEKILLAYEFENLDQLVGMHMFDKYVLFGYAIKLKLLERQACFRQEKGKAEFSRLFQQVQEGIVGSGQ